MPQSENKPAPSETERVFRAAVSAWANRDLDVVMSLMADNVVRSINVDGEQVPFAASAVGKDAVREKLQLMLDTFEFGAFVTDFLKVDGAVARSRIMIIFRHIASGEILNTRFRLVIEQSDGLIVRMDEFHDPFYLEAFMRLVEDGNQS